MEVVQQYKFSETEEKELRAKFDTFLSSYFTSPEEAKDKLAQLLRPEAVVRTEGSIHSPYPNFQSPTTKKVVQDQEVLTIREFCVRNGLVAFKDSERFRIWFNATKTYIKKANLGIADNYVSVGRKGNASLYPLASLEKALKAYQTK